MLTVLSVIGTRPEAIKMAPVIRQLDKHRDRVRSLVCVTGQHRQLLDQVLNLFDVRPDHDLNVMQPDQALSQLTADLLVGLDSVVSEAEPDWILAEGDTTSVLAAALVAHYRGILFGHVEAGLRTRDKRRPFPEEVNRRLADAVADLLFAPTQHARQALLREGLPEANIHVTGNTVVDALESALSMEYDTASGSLADLPSERRIVLVTAHRREILGERFRELCSAVRELAISFEAENVHFVYPVHPNPNVRGPAREILSGLGNVSAIEPLDYLAMLHMIKRSILILTDSGGIQEEAPSLGVPVLVMRDVTDRPEGLQAGVARLVGTQRDPIVKEASRLLRDAAALKALTPRLNPYGDGRAAERIVSILLGRAPA